MMDKKGIIRLTLMKFIIGIITLAILLFLITNVVYPFIFSSTTKEACRTSVLLRSWILEKEPGIVEPLFKANPINCKTEYKCLTNGGECPQKYQKIKVEDDRAINAELAGSLYDCWWMLGEGKAEFLGDWESGVYKGDSHCVICSVISFDDKIKYQKEKVGGLNKYMNEEKIPGKNITFSQYITFNITGKTKDEGAIDEISTAKQYAVVFIIGKSTTVGRILTHAAAGAAGGVAIGFVFPGLGNLIGLGGGAIGGTILGLVESVLLTKPEFATALILADYNAEGITQSCGVLESLP